jgi:hypothetical protein
VNRNLKLREHAEDSLNRARRSWLELAGIEGGTDPGFLRAKSFSSEIRRAYAACVRRGSLNPIPGNPAPLRSFHEPVPECVRHVERAQPFQSVGEKRVSVNRSVQSLAAGGKPSAVADEFRAGSKVCDQEPRNHGSRHPDIDSEVGYTPDD